MSEVTCHKCGGYVPGHATGSGDICTCEPITTGDEELTRLLAELAKAKADVARLREQLQGLQHDGGARSAATAPAPVVPMLKK